MVHLLDDFFIRFDVGNLIDDCAISNDDSFMIWKVVR